MILTLMSHPLTMSDPITYLPLDKTYAKNGYHFNLVLRDGDVAVYAQCHRPNGTPVAYEVFKVKRVKETIMFGRVIPAHEAVPSNEEWGTKGWTIMDLHEAKRRAYQLASAKPGRKQEATL